jgi:hypothetical protein
MAPSGDSEAAVAVVLEHADPTLALPLYVSSDGDDVNAEWRSWGQVLGLPLLVANDDGSVHEPFARMGCVRIAEPTQRRRRRSALKRRRPTILMRRRPGKVTEATPIHRAQLKIIYNAGA